MKEIKIISVILVFAICMISLLSCDFDNSYSHAPTDAPSFPSDTPTSDQTEQVTEGAENKEPEEYFTYESNPDGPGFMVTGVKNFQGTSLVIPETHNGIPVTRIGNMAFASTPKLTNVTVPDSVTFIGSGAFQGCSSLRNINIPDSITCIDGWAFFGCSRLTNINIPSSVTRIGDNAFFYCHEITEVEGGVSYVDNWAITFDSSTTTVRLRSNTVGIADSAFQSCSGLESVTIPDIVKNLSYGSFAGCAELKEINFQGTKAEWKAKPKDDSWDYNAGNYTVFCTDGTIAQDGTET